MSETERLAEVIELAKYRPPMAQDNPDHWSHKPSPMLSDVIMENNELRKKVEQITGSLQFLLAEHDHYVELLREINIFASVHPFIETECPEILVLLKEFQE